MAYPANGILFNSVTRFVEQVGQRQIFKFNELDGLTCTFVGPSAQAWNFKPAIDSQHPQFPLMYCTESEVTQQAALIAEVRATYIGKLQFQGSKVYRTPPVISTSPTQGSREFLVQWSQQIQQVQYATGAATQLGPHAVVSEGVWAFGTQKVNVRYIGSQSTVKYHVFPKVDVFAPYYTDEGFGAVGWEVMSSYPSDITVLGTFTGMFFNVYEMLPHIPTTTPPIRVSFLGMSTTQKSLKWFEVTESYGVIF